MAVENKFVGVLRERLIEKVGEEGAAQAFTSLTVAASWFVKISPNERDQDLIRAIRGLREGGEVQNFDSAVEYLSNELLNDPSLSPRDLIKAAAREAGHSVSVWSDIDSLQDEANDDDTPPQRVAEANAWGLRRDSSYRHGELLPVSSEMLIELRESLAQARCIEVHSAGKLMLSVGNAAVAAARKKNGVTEGARRSRLALSSMAVDVAGLVEDSTWRLDIAEVPEAWGRLDDEQTTILALALPMAGSMADVDDLLAMAREDQLLALHGMGNLCKAWLERGRKGQDAGEVPSLAQALGKKMVKRAVRRARAVEPVVAPVVDTTAFAQGPLDLFPELLAEVAAPAEKPVCRAARKPAGRCHVAARRVRARRRCDRTVDLFGDLAAAPVGGGKEGVEPAREVVSRVIGAVRRGGPLQGLALGVPEPVERGGGLLEVVPVAEVEGVLS